VSAALRTTDVLFGPFHFDVVNQCLWRGPRRLSLRPKAFAVLRVLVEHAGQVVTREEFLEAVWPDTCVSDGVLRFCLRELRQALKDQPHAPRFIETVHRRGYRFIAPVRHDQQTERVASAPAVPFTISKSPPPVGLNRNRPKGNGPQRSSSHETITHLASGIELLQTLPDSPERAQQELVLHLALGAPLIAAKGPAAPEVEQMYARACELCRRMGETEQLFPVLWGLVKTALVSFMLVAHGDRLFKKSSTMRLNSSGFSMFTRCPAPGMTSFFAPAMPVSSNWTMLWISG
jgi:DNA-binding winged helix-turn-helix (wHTH) protein